MLLLSVAILKASFYVSRKPKIEVGGCLAVKSNWERLFYLLPCGKYNSKRLLFLKSKELLESTMANTMFKTALDAYIMHSQPTKTRSQKTRQMNNLREHSF